MNNEKSEDVPSVSRKRRRKEMQLQLHVNTSKGSDHQNAIEALEKAMETIPVPTVQSSSQRNQLEILFEERKFDEIPRIVNRIMKESSGLDRRYDLTSILIQKLLDILLRYITALSGKVKKNSPPPHTTASATRTRAATGEDQSSVQTNGSIIDFQRIATKWANNCICELTKPHDNSSVPILDALLVEMGGWDFASHEMAKKDALISSSCFFNENGSLNQKEESDEFEHAHASWYPNNLQEELEKDDADTIKHPFLLQMKQFLKDESDRNTSLEDLLI